MSNAPRGTITSVLLAALPLIGFLTAEEADQLIIPVALAAAAMLLKLEPRMKLSAAAWRFLSVGALGLFLFEWQIAAQSGLMASAGSFQGTPRLRTSV